MSSDQKFNLRGIGVDARLRGPIEPFSRILVVEDEPFLNGVVAIALRRVGYNVATAEDGEEAWNAVQDEPFDLLVTDDVMPRLSGVGLLRRLRTNQINLPAILMCAKIPPEIGEVVEQGTSGGTLQKPFGLHELYYKVGMLLDGIRPPATDRQRAVSPISRELGRYDRSIITKAADDRLMRLAMNLLRHESVPGDPAAVRLALPVLCRRMQDHLVPLCGAMGFKALLTRALGLLHPEVPWLAGVTVSRDGLLIGLESASGKVTPFEVHRGEILVVAKVLGVLISFLGEGVVRSCLHDVWHQEL